ncbi:hypothetical protein AC579_7184 [Pseudocercospora musae]|uniref:RNA exonuclease 4 n=1 Tax=Pseudocercospora musae TaxID=113226 RepID=A0A139I4P8_9PEZI|nr:hypothetical protein AC579_7184 [Pseudocercospora musae]
MSPSDAGQLSSNWKKLQEKLKAEKKAEGAGSGTKRKREEAKKSKTSANAFKKPRLSGANAIAGDKKRKMGGYLSTDAANQDTSSASKTQSLIKDHDIAPADVSAAYGAVAAPVKRLSEDEINRGLHPTRKIGKYVSLDCEMVGTGPPPHLDNILARASLVNLHGEQIYDSYAQPPPGVKVEDYRTYVSGIKPHHLKPGYARTFKEVQKDVADILQGRILVGHALRNDLNALMLSHPKRDMRDTSRHPKFRVDSKGKPPALRKLARSELGIDVQTGEHSSVEDARTAMLLFHKEKKSFEEENRKHFGTRRVFAGKEKTRAVREETPEVDEDEEAGEDEDDDLDVLEGEEDLDAVEHETTSAQPAQAKAKKRKKKKRTKRK